MNMKENARREMTDYSPPIIPAHILLSLCIWTQFLFLSLCTDLDSLHLPISVHLPCSCYNPGAVLWKNSIKLESTPEKKESMILIKEVPNIREQERTCIHT